MRVAHNSKFKTQNSKLLIYPLYLRSAIVVQQDLVVVIALGTHYGSTNLAESHAVSPACTRESECLWHAVLYVLLVYDERAAIEMRIAQRTAYLQFLTDSEGALRSHNLQAADASAAATLHRHEDHGESCE